MGFLCCRQFTSTIHWAVFLSLSISKKVLTALFSLFSLLSIVNWTEQSRAEKTLSVWFLTNRSQMRTAEGDSPLLQALWRINFDQMSKQCKLDHLLPIEFALRAHAPSVVLLWGWFFKNQTESVFSALLWLSPKPWFYIWLGATWRLAAWKRGN